jgi:hypothetical protein
MKSCITLGDQVKCVFEVGRIMDSNERGFENRGQGNGYIRLKNLGKREDIFFVRTQNSVGPA